MLWRHCSQEFHRIAILQLLFVIFLFASIIVTAYACHIYVLIITELQTVSVWQCGGSTGYVAL